MTDYRIQQWHDEIEETARENRERFWREAAEAAEYWRRVAAGEVVDQPGDDDDECEIEDRREDRCTVPGVPVGGGRSECDRADEASDVEDDAAVRRPECIDGAGLDSPRTDGDMPAEGGAR